MGGVYSFKYTPSLNIKKMEKDQFRTYGTCELCKMEDTIVVKYKNKWYHKYCRDIQRDKDKAKTDKRLKKGYDEFSRLLKKL